jgi:hypothetical protein
MASSWACTLRSILILFFTLTLTQAAPLPSAAAVAEGGRIQKHVLPAPSSESHVLGVPVYKAAVHEVPEVHGESHGKLKVRCEGRC